MQDVGLAVAGDEIQAAGDADTLLVEVDGEDLIANVVLAALRLLLHREQVRLGQAFVVEDGFPDVENGVNGKAGGTAGGINQRLVLLRVEHLDAHVNDPARREILALLTLGRLVDEVFKGVVHHVEIGVEELPFFQRADADLQMVGGEFDFFVGWEDACPLFLRVVEKAWMVVLSCAAVLLLRKRR